MALYFFQYELRNKRDYSEFYAEFAKLEAIEVLDGLWCFKLDKTSCLKLRERFFWLVERDDGLMFIKATDWASLTTRVTALHP